MNLLIDWTDDDLIAQCMGFLLAGFDTVSTLMCFTVHELALNIDVQEKLYAEIEQTFSGTFDYEALSKMKYLDMVVSESLRKWTPTPGTDRCANKPFNLKIDDGHEVEVGVGQAIIIPTHSLHRDPKYFPDPERFDPERFSKENIDKIVSGTYLPFGMGPRNCIGSRFAIMETKLVIYHLLCKYKFEKCDKTSDPIQLAVNALGLGAKNGFWIQFGCR